MWGNYVFDFASSLSRGRSGGMISIWDPNFFSKEQIWCEDRYIIVKGKWANSDEVFYMINLYGPQESSEKISLWNRLSDFIANHEGKFVLFGDFNEVRDESERHDTEFDRNQAQIFNTFIDHAGLFDIPISGLTALPRGWSDHTLIMLHFKKDDYGPIPFKFFHSWLQRDGFNDCVMNAYKECSHDNPLMTFHDKLKVMKYKIKALNSLAKCRDTSRQLQIKSKLLFIDDKINSGTTLEEEKVDRLNLLKEREDIQKLEDMDTVQKARIKWDIEGDENSKFFHGILKQKRHHQTVKGEVQVFYNITNFPTVIPHSSLNNEDNLELEKSVSMDEIKAVVWDCGSQKAPSPDGKWRRWIKMCLHSTRMSVLVNGIPSSEFLIKRGLRQGDPLSPFLFIIVMERLHLALEDAVSSGLIHGAKVGNIPFSYLGLPIGSNMNMIANWQHLIDHFRGKLSSWKANLLSIGGRLTLIKAVLGSLGIYYMSIFKCPELVINALESMRATFFWGGSGDNRKMAWIKWDNILASLDKGGLEIGSLKAFNLALLQKWCCRLVHSPKALWVRVIKAIHGDEADFDFQGCNSNGIWSAIISSFSSSHARGIITSDSLFRKVGNESSIRFWKDNWDKNGPLSARYNRLFHLDSNENCVLADRFVNNTWNWNWKRSNIGSRNMAALDRLISNIGNVSFNNAPDSWSWKISNDDPFSVQATRFI
ncbi:RNA-directed DNA polymerase, eukaryota, reverse transcriptase zinc-binding domain protein [Tanacetum coccineum]